MGRVLDTLEEKGLREDTLVIYCSDHGELLYQHGICEKHTMFEAAISIPLILSLPGRIAEGISSDALVENIDILPTAMNIVGIGVPEWVNGVDLSPTFEGGDVKEHVFCEYHHTLDATRMLRTKRYKFIYTEDDINELYDMEHDPEEKYNLTFYPQYKEIAAQMEAKVLEDWDPPDVPEYGKWNDLNERKQKQILDGLLIQNVRPDPPRFVTERCDTGE
ncbi:MAG: sulfatase-like hydrolase/transferase [Lentisphaerae bacterium]|nr:sulfatase-like hydrolase/transferase [Lentisphaerota bacterium]